MQRISNVDGRGVTVKDIMEKYIMTGKWPSINDAKPFDVSVEAKENMILLPTFLSPACFRLLQNVPAAYMMGRAMDYESRLGSLLYHTNELMGAFNEALKKQEPFGKVVRADSNAAVLEMSLKMPYTAFRHGHGHTEETAYFLVEIRRMTEGEGSKTGLENIRVVIGLDLRYHA